MESSLQALSDDMSPVSLHEAVHSLRPVESSTFSNLIDVNVQNVYSHPGFIPPSSTHANFGYNFVYSIDTLLALRFSSQPAKPNRRVRRRIYYLGIGVHVPSEPTSEPTERRINDPKCACRCKLVPHQQMQPHQLCKYCPCVQARALQLITMACYSLTAIMSSLRWCVLAARLAALTYHTAYAVSESMCVYVKYMKPSMPSPVPNDKVMSNSPPIINCTSRRTNANEMTFVNLQHEAKKVGHIKIMKRKRMKTKSIAINRKDKNFECKMGLMNCRSINNKTAIISLFIVDSQIDVIFLTETWLKTGLHSEWNLADATPNGFKSHSIPRDSGRGGGLAIIHKDCLKVSVLPHLCFSTFESALYQIKAGIKQFHVLLIYRPPCKSVSEFISNFSDQLSSMSLYSELVVLGDFNIPMDLQNPNSLKLLNTTAEHNLHVHRNGRTHEKGHELDLVMTRSESQMVSHTKSSEGIADHDAIIIHCNLKCPKQPQKLIVHRNFKHFDINLYRQHLAQCDFDFLEDKTFSTAQIVKNFNGVLLGVLNNHAPIKNQTISVKTQIPWYSPELAAMKQIKRKTFKKWRKSHLELDKQAFCIAKKNFESAVLRAKEYHLSDIVSENRTDSKRLWSTLNKLMHRKKQLTIPQEVNTNNKEVPKKFNEFFINKINDMHQALVSKKVLIDIIKPANVEVPVSVKILKAQLPYFESADADEISSLIRHSPLKSGRDDPITMKILKCCIDILATPITKLTNRILDCGMPDELKLAKVTPLLKKRGVDNSELNNYRPISQLPLISKIIEKIVQSRLMCFFEENHLNDKYQSAYRPHHSTETALVYLVHELMSAIDRKEVTILVSIDLSAAFDTVDHGLLLHKFIAAGVTDKALKWIASYLTGRTQYVEVQDVKSPPLVVKHGVPQGSVLGPILFSFYTRELGQLIDSYGLKRNHYADDTQIYVSCPVSNFEAAVKKVETCLDAVREWLLCNFLQMNPAKTEAIVFGSRALLKKVPKIAVRVGESSISFGSTIKILGLTLDSELKFDIHITNVCKMGFGYIRILAGIRRTVNKQSLKMLMHSMVLSRIDYAIATLTGIDKKQIKRLQRIENAAARMVCHLTKFESSNEALAQLGWLSVHSRIQQRVTQLVFNVINGNAAEYLREIFHPYTPERNLRSADDRLLEVPKTRTATGDRAFAVFGARTWNSLPISARTSEKLSSFQHKLKKHLL